MTDSAEAILSAAFVRGRSGRKAKSSFQVIVEVFVVSLGMSGEDCRRYLETEDRSSVIRHLGFPQTLSCYHQQSTTLVHYPLDR
jgi:hypothetical protein